MVTLLVYHLLIHYIENIIYANSIWGHLVYRMAKMHGMPYLSRSFPAIEPYKLIAEAL